ncbi:YggT family protein [Sphingorhabdus sp.]|jgi:YggT family protein|uniref:YggT family protein n=1 Tax=Sphingorhabdus sp. TaxID=1902408 RepID=UPI002C991861|nr:YggT family protein [Sphingorhabdus sp.]HMT41675.1 YggT family protein [Sphingorhabdus sp.]
MLLALIQILGMLINIVVTVVIAQFILSLLIAFNVVSLTNNFVAALWQALNAILDPVLRPIRKIMPDTGMIDFSPMALIFALYSIQIILEQLYRNSFSA